jgi:hypothetical protein
MTCGPGESTDRPGHPLEIVDRPLDPSPVIAEAFAHAVEGPHRLHGRPAR